MTDNNDTKNEEGIYITFTTIGKSTKVTAIDSKTYTEVSVIAPAQLSKESMKTLVLQKLKWKINK
jgi:hypothetical protein